MALPVGASHGRANLIREMARSRSSNASDTGSDYAPESQLLPPGLTAATPQNASTFHSEPEFQINTSALRRAFPDFSQYASSEGDSLEIGRGAAPGLHHNPRAFSSQDPSENISLNLGDERYTVTGTPPMKPKAPKPTAAQRNPSGKENADPLAKTTHFVSSSSSRDSRGSRQALGELDPNVELDDSVDLAQDLPKSSNTRQRSNRFAASRTRSAGDHSHDAVHMNPTVDSLNSAANGTYQSFALPDLPNITELVSGQRRDGTPLFSRSAKSRSRFATPSAYKGQSDGRSFPSVNAPTPADAKALHVSLQLLQEKVATLEREKAQAVEKADSYELECLQLKSRLESKEDELARHHSDSGVDVDNEEETKTKEWDTERARFESSIKSLQGRLNRANKKVSESEATINHLIKDRDAAHQQLAMAYVNSEELRNEEQAVRDEIESVKSQLSKVTRQHEKRIERLTHQEAELKQKIDRRERAVKQMAALARDLWATRNALAARSAGAGLQPSRTQTQRPRSNSRGASSHSRVRAEQQQQYSNHIQEPTQNTGITTIDVEDPEMTTHLDFDAAQMRPQTTELSKDESFMSFMEGDEVAKLRRIVEQDKARLAAAGVNVDALVNHDTLTGALRNARPDAALPQKSSLKQPSVLVPQTQPAVSRREDDTQPTVASQRSEARRRSAALAAEDMTSALILPDITLTGAALAGQATTLHVKRPVPVSERPVSAAGENRDMTVRPALSPGLALATVLQGLEEEVARLRAQLAEQENLYNQHDPALGKRERKLVYARIQKLLATIDGRCDQIYALYDVLEGQKDAGQCMDESEVELTLQNLGIRVERVPSTRQQRPQSMHRRRRSSGSMGNKQDQKARRKSVVIDVDEDTFPSDEDDLPYEPPSDIEDGLRNDDPWEGFGSTQTHTQTHTLGSVRA